VPTDCAKGEAMAEVLKSAVRIKKIDVMNRPPI